MEKKTKHFRLFYQYLLSYICILLLPLSVLSVFIYSYVLDILQEEIYVNNIDTLQKAQNTIEAQLQNITSLEHKVYLGKMLKGFVLQNDTIAAISTKKELEKYWEINPFLVDIAYYQEDDDYIIAASSSCRKEEFWQNMYLWKSWDYETFCRDLKEKKDFFFVEAQDVLVKRKNLKKIVTLVIPLDEQQKRCVLMMLEEKFFTNTMPQTDPEREVSAIIDSNGKTIISHGKSELIDSVYASGGKDQGTNLVTIDGIEYLRSSVYSESYQWNYESLVLISEIEKKIAYVRFLMTFICIFVCVAGALGILFFMKRNYIPIHTLELASNRIIENIENRNEIDHVTAVLEYLDRQNRKLKIDEENRNHALKDRFFMKWLSGWYETRQQIEEQAAGVGMILDKEKYQVAIMRICKSVTGKEQLLETIIQRMVPINVDVLVRVQVENERILMAVGYDMTDREEVEQYYENLIAYLKNEYHSKIWVVQGSSKQDNIDLKVSYMEALKAMEYCIILDDTDIIRYEEIVCWVGNGMVDIQPKRLENYIRNHDTIGLEHFLKTSLHEMKERKLDIRQVRMLCNEFIYTLEKIVLDMNRDYFIENPLYDNLSGILQ